MFLFPHSNLVYAAILFSTHLFHFLSFLVSAVALGYILISEDLELGTTDERVYMFAFQVWISPINIVFSGSIHLPADFMILFLQWNSILNIYVYQSINL